MLSVSERYWQNRKRTERLAFLDYEQYLLHVHLKCELFFTYSFYLLLLFILFWLPGKVVNLRCHLPILAQTGTLEKLHDDGGDGGMSDAVNSTSHQKHRQPGTVLNIF